jgi:hypothetical protein
LISVDELIELLGPTSHGESGLDSIRLTLETLDPVGRANWIAENLITDPLTHEVALERTGTEIEAFRVLQGDIIRTSSAYDLGVRIDGEALYMIATSSCDLIEGRRSNALLLPIRAKRRRDFASPQAFGGELSRLTLYQPKKHFYLPPLPGDGDDVVFNVALLDPIHIIANAQVNIAQRIGSLSCVGWRIFGVLVRELLIRQADDEEEMRRAP